MVSGPLNTCRRNRIRLDPNARRLRFNLPRFCQAARYHDAEVNATWVLQRGGGRLFRVFLVVPHYETSWNSTQTSLQKHNKPNKYASGLECASLDGL